MSKSSDLIYENLFLNSGQPRHISVFISGAERIGSSWCAINMAYALNKEKKRVLMVDGNGNFSNIEANISLHEPLFLEEYFSGKKTLNQIVIPYKSKDFHILTGKNGNNYSFEIPLGRIQIFAEDLNILAKNYNHTIIDIGTGITDKNLSLCQIADNILLMCSENNADLVKTFDLIKFLNETELGDNCNLIINKVNSFEDGYKIYEKLNKAAERNGLKCPPLLGIVRFDTRIRETIRNKELLLTLYGASEAAIDICALTKKLIQENFDD